MELGHYLDFLRHRIWLVVLAAMLAATTMTGLSLRSRPEYQTEATVLVPSLAGGGTAVRQLVADLDAVIGGEEHAGAVAERTGIDARHLDSRFDVRQVGDSSAVRWRLRTSEDLRSEAPEILVAAIDIAQRMALAPDLAQAQAQLDTASAALEEAQAALGEFTTSTGLAEPDSYDRLQSELTGLRIRAETARAEGDDALARSLDGQIESLQTFVTMLAQQVAEYESLAAARDRAQTRLDRAQAEVDAVQARIAALGAQSASTVGTPHRITSTMYHVRRIVAAAITGALLMAATLLLVERRRAKQDRERVSRVAELRRTLSSA